jgi:outer membrane protein OmpA-like peptidoglycan-associated protein
MRFLVLALSLFAFAAPAMAQHSEMDAAEAELRSSLAPSGVAVERAAPDELRLIMPSDITFDFNRAELRYEFIPRVRDLAATLRRYKDFAVEIVGHADAIGSDAYNQRLSERRAEAVGDVLMREGIWRQRIAARGQGEFAPIAPNTSEWGRARNRRVEVRILAGKK